MAAKFYMIPHKEIEILLKRVQLLSIDIEMALLKKQCEINDGNTLIKFDEEFLNGKSIKLSETEKDTAGKQSF